MTKDEAFKKFWNTEIVSAVTGKVDVPMWGDIDRNDTAYIFMAGYKACKEALEQPAQEPVAHIKQGMDGYPKLVFNGKFEYESIAAKWDDIALYTHPAPSWQGLSNDLVRAIGEKCQEENRGILNWIDFYNAIESMLKDKNYE